MEILIDCLVPGVLVAAAMGTLLRKQNSYKLFLEGAWEGILLLKTIFPSLLALLVAVKMLRASGGAEVLEQLLSPLFQAVGIPKECALLVVVRPLSGSAALAVGAEIMGQYGVDSEIGRMAAVMLGSTETTFYTISVYFGAAGVEKTRYAVPAALFADFVGFTMAALWVRVLY